MSSPIPVLVAACAIFLSGCTTSAGVEPASALNQEIAYRARVAGLEETQRIVVFNFATGHARDADVRYLKNGDPSFFGDLGGHFSICSNTEFLCVDTDTNLRLAIPRNLFTARQTHWSYRDLTCDADGSEYRPNQRAIVCSSDGHFYWAYYVNGRGIVSYLRSLEPDVFYDLEGPKGLLSDDTMTARP